MNVAGFYDESISNGLGWRCVLFVSGCPHHCPSCQNLIAQDYTYGNEINEEELLERIKNNSILNGLTFSGGEPLCPENVAGVLHFLKRVKEIKPDFDYWCYTGYTFEELLSRKDDITNELLNNIDVLVDGRFIELLKNEELLFRGSSNQRLIDVKRTLKENKVVELSI